MRKLKPFGAVNWGRVAAGPPLEPQRGQRVLPVGFGCIAVDSHASRLRGQTGRYMRKICRALRLQRLSMGRGYSVDMLLTGLRSSSSAWFAFRRVFVYNFCFRERPHANLDPDRINMSTLIALGWCDLAERGGQLAGPGGERVGAGNRHARTRQHSPVRRVSGAGTAPQAVPPP